MTIGAKNGGGQNFLDGDVCEVMEYSKGLDSEELELIETYAVDKWATP